MGKTRVRTFNITNYGSVTVPIASKKNRGKLKYIDKMLKNAILSTYGLVIDKTAKSFSESMDSTLPSTEKTVPHKHNLKFMGCDSGEDYGTDETVAIWTCTGCGIDYLAAKKWFYNALMGKEYR